MTTLSKKQRTVADGHDVEGASSASMLPDNVLRGALLFLDFLGLAKAAQVSTRFCELVATAVPVQCETVFGVKCPAVDNKLAWPAVASFASAVFHARKVGIYETVHSGFFSSLGAGCHFANSEGPVAYVAVATAEGITCLFSQSLCCKGLSSDGPVVLASDGSRWLNHQCGFMYWNDVFTENVGCHGRDIEALGMRLKFINIVLVPLLIIIVALVFAQYRRKRREEGMV